MDDVDKIFDSFPVLNTERLCLRQIRPSDNQAIFNIFNDPEVTRYYGMKPFSDMAEADALIVRWRRRFSERRLVRWVLAKLADDWVIGTAGFTDWKRHFRSAQVGYDLAQPFWQQGYMREALTAVLEFGYSHMQLNRIEALVLNENIASIALLDKLGFKKEGLLREYGYWGQTHHDLNLFALLKRDFLSQ